MRRLPWPKIVVIAAALLLPWLWLGPWMKETYLKQARTAQLERWVEAFPGDVRAQFYLSNRYRESGDQDKAIECLRRVVALKPDFGIAWLGMGQLLLSRKELWPAIEALERALQLNPRLWTAAQPLGATYNQIGMYEHGVASLEKAVAAVPEQPPVWDGLAHIYLRLGDPERAERIFQGMIQHMAGMPAARIGLGYVAIERGQWDEAEKILLSQIEKYHFGKEAERGLIHLYCRRPEKFLMTTFQMAMVRRVAATYAGDWEPHYLLGRHAAAQRRWQEAEAALHRAARRGPTEALIWEELAALYRQIGRTAKQREAEDRAHRCRQMAEETDRLQRQVEGGAADAETYLRLADLWEERGEPGTALEACLAGSIRYPAHLGLARRIAALKLRLAERFRKR